MYYLILYLCAPLSNLPRCAPGCDSFNNTRLIRVDSFQSVIASTHADGSFFMTPEGNYVQLINGVLTNVDVTPMMQVLKKELQCVPWSLRSQPLYNNKGIIVGYQFLA